MAKNVLLSLNMRIDEAADGNEFLGALYTSLAGRQPTDPITVPAARFSMAPGVLVSATRRYVQVSVNDESPVEAKSYEIVSIVRRLEDVLNAFLPVEGVVQSQWLHDHGGDWESLVKRYARAFLTESVPGAADYSILADFPGDGWSGNMQTGPMERAQFKAINAGLEWSEAAIPDRFFYFAYSYRALPAPAAEEMLSEGVSKAVALADFHTSLFARVKP